MISLVIPTLNEAASLPLLMNALRPIAERGAEVLVVDGGSDDDTVALASAAGARVIHSARGRARQMNAGAAQARGDLLLFLHADSAPDARWCDAVLALPENACWGFFRPRLIGRSRWLALIGWCMWQRSRLTGIATGDQCIWVRRASVDPAVFPDQPLMEDIEFCARARRYARPLAVPVALGTSGRRWDNNGVFKTVVLMWQLRLRYQWGASPHALWQRYYGGDS